MFFKSKRIWLITIIGILLAIRVFFFHDVTLYDLYEKVLKSKETLSSKTPNVYSKLVTDNAGLFSTDEKEYIGEYHTMLLDLFDLDYRIVTLNEKIDIGTYAVKRFNEQKIGRESKTNRGLLLVIDMMHDRVRIEVSANLESVYTDAFVSYLEKRQMIQFFKERRVADGVFATSELIRIRAMEAKNGEEFDKTQFTGSIGGGAETKANIGAGKDLSMRHGKPNVLAAGNPEKTLKRYISALSHRNGRNDLDVFTLASREFMGTMLSTPAQMDNSVKRMKNCEVEHVTYNKDRTRAVLFHSLKHRECDPFLFEIGQDKKWRLDLKALGLGTNHTFGNIWYVHFGRQQDSGFWRYGFGFKNVYFHRPKGENGRFDHQGIPYYNTFGMRINHITSDMVITDIHRGGFMDKSGFKSGDKIIEWEGLSFLHTSNLSRRLERVRPSLDIFVVIDRDGKRINKFMKAPPYPKKGQYRFGFSYQSNGFTRKPIVHYVEPNSQAAILGLEEGDLIHKWQNIDAPNMGDVYKSIKSTKNGTKIQAEIYRNGRLITLKTIKRPLRVMSKVH